jgi:hypothetical protein
MSDIPETTRRSRRNVLAVGGAAALGAAAGALVRPGQALAGTDGDVVLGAVNAVTNGNATQITGDLPNNALFIAGNGSPNSPGGIIASATGGAGGVAIQAFTDNGVGVEGIDFGTGIGLRGTGATGVDGHSVNGVAVHGYDDDAGTGVHGESRNGEGVIGISQSVGPGVHGEAGFGGIGVLAESNAGFAVKALVTGGTATQGTALVASTIGDVGSLGGRYGVYAYGGTAGVFAQSVDSTGAGVVGENDVGGVGVQAIAIRPGKALDVQGAARFSTSGVATIAGTTAVPLTSIVITGADVTRGSVVLATPQTHVAGVAVSAAVVNATAKTITIFLTTPVTKNVKIAWFTLN